MIVRDTLDNGIRLVTESMGHVRSVSLGVWLSRGSRHETDEESGIAHFVEHMLFRGTERFPTSLALNTAIEELGSTLHAETGRVPIIEEMLSEVRDALDVGLERLAITW